MLIKHEVGPVKISVEMTYQELVNLVDSLSAAYGEEAAHLYVHLKNLTE